MNKNALLDMSFFKRWKQDLEMKNCSYSFSSGFCHHNHNQHHLRYILWEAEQWSPQHDLYMQISVVRSE